MTDPPPLASRVFSNKLKIRHLELLRNVCACRSLRKAADASAMTQPAATKLIQELEAIVGRPLFTRDRRGMTPTPYGLAVLHHANIVMADLGNMREEVELLAHGATGNLRLGIVPSLSPQLLTRVIGQTLTAWPGVRISLREASTSQLLAELAANELDLAFARLLNASALRDFAVLDIYAESFAVVCSTRNALAGKRRVSWRDLAGARWLMPTSGTPLRELLSSQFRREKALTPTAAVEHGSFEKVQYLIGGTDLVGLLPVSMAAAAQDRGEVKIIGPRLADFGPISLVRRVAADAPPVVLLFTEIVREVGQSARRTWPTPA